MPLDRDGDDRGFFDVTALAAALPETVTTLMADRYLTDREAASARVVRIYQPAPPHYHATCDEYLYVLSGRAAFWIAEAGEAREIGPGQLVVFARGTIHGIPQILEHPFTLLAIDTPRRDPKDIVFVDPSQGSPATFMRRNAPGG